MFADYYVIKNLQNLRMQAKDKLKDYLPYIYAVLGVVGTVLLILVLSKAYKFFKFLFGWIPDKKDSNENKKE